MIADARARLAANDLPPALLPDNLSTFDLAPDGRFTVKLAGPVSFKADKFTVTYAVALSGRLSHGRIEDLRGVKVKGGPAIFAVPVSAIAARGDHLVFTVLGTHHKLPRALFA